MLLLVACNAPPERKLPSSSIAPQLSNRPPEAACGTDIAVDETGRIAMRYRYSYDPLGRLALAIGTFTDTPGVVDTIEYDWDNLDHLVHFVQQRPVDGVRVEVATQYNTLGDMLEYAYAETSGRYAFDMRYVYSAFTEAGQPTRELVIERGSETRYQLAYDANGRIAVAAPEGDGDATVYTYDDDGRTITVDTGNGAYRGQLVYDDENHELSETWSGSDAAAIASDDRYDWLGDRLVKVTHRTGSYDAPHELRVVEIDTHLYDCPQ